MRTGLLELPNDRHRPDSEQAGALRLRPQGRSLDKGIHLATSETKHCLAEKRHSRTSPAAKRKGQIRLQLQLLTSLEIIASRNQEVDMCDAWEGRRQRESGPWRPSSDWRRINQCQKEWRGFQPTCCASAAVAVPIGCNHRLCSLCAAQRLERYRGPVREMLAAMENPSFLTLTIPNCGRLTHTTFKQIRKWWKAFYRANEAFLQGGVYAIEATFNRLTRTWHPHLHIIFDSPYKLSGITRPTFMEAKLRLEFSWLRMTSISARKVFKKSEFARWRTEGSKQPKGSPWNKTYRRVLDLRAVKQGNGAVNECIKYITKTTRFLDIPEVVAEFLMAVRGVRVTQSFGMYYNWKLEEEDEPIRTEAVLGEFVSQRQSYLRCDCGQNQFLSIGLFSESRVLQQPDGRWIIDPQEIFHRCRDRGHPEENDMAQA